MCDIFPLFNSHCTGVLEREAFGPTRGNKAMQEDDIKKILNIIRRKSIERDEAANHDYYTNKTLNVKIHCTKSKPIAIVMTQYYIA